MHQPVAIKFEDIHNVFIHLLYRNKFCLLTFSGISSHIFLFRNIGWFVVVVTQKRKEKYKFVEHFSDVCSSLLLFAW